MKRVEAPELLAKPDCELCGKPYWSHQVGSMIICPIVPTYRPSISTPSPEIAGLVSALEASDGMSIGPNGSGGTKVLINFADHVPAGKLFSLLSDLSALATWSKP